MSRNRKPSNAGVLSQKAAIYIRVSTKYQIDKDSLAVQRRELEAYAEYVLGIKDYEVFEDPGYSGKNTNRPAYREMFERLRTGEFSHLLVWKIDRISRNLLDFAEMYNELKRIGVTFVSKNEQFDTSSAMGEAMLKIILVFAELERQMTSERVSAVMLSRAQGGQWNGGRIPYGYSYDRKRKAFSVNEKEAAVVQEMYDYYEEHQSLLELCDHLNGRGIKTKNGNAWSPVTASKVLKNVFYTGVYRYNVHSQDGANKGKDEWINIADHHPAIISEVQRDRVEVMLRKNQRGIPGKPATYRRKYVHLFAGLMTCGDCGSNITATTGHRRANGYMPSMYGCARRRKHSGSCTNKFVSDAYVAPFILYVLSKLIHAPADAEALSSEDAFSDYLRHPVWLLGVEKVEGCGGVIEAVRDSGDGTEYFQTLFIRKSGRDADPDALNGKKKRLASSLRRLQSLYLHGDGSISEKDYLIERKSIMDDLEDIESKLSSSGESSGLFQDKASYFVMINSLLDYDPASSEKFIRATNPELLKAFLNQVMENIVVTGGRITRMTFQNGLSLEFLYE